MDELIEAARANTKDLRKGAADVEAAERWERLAGAARLVLDAVRQTVDQIAVTQEQITRNVEQLTAGQERMTREISRLQAIEQHKNSEPPPRSARLRHANPLRNRRRHRRRADSESGPGDSHPISAMQLAGEQRRYLGRLAAERVREDKVLVAL